MRTSPGSHESSCSDDAPFMAGERGCRLMSVESGDISMTEPRGATRSRLPSVHHPRGPPRSRLLPFNDPSRRRRLVKVGAWLVGVAIAVLVLNLLGVDIGGWLRNVWDALKDISFWYLAAGWAVQTVQTTLTALAWYFILRAGYPRAPFSYLQILAAYAAGVALNGFLPANLGTFVMLLMFVALIQGATFAGVLGGMVVQKIFFTVVGTLVYLY